MPRLPERYRTRWGYAVLAGLSGVLFSTLAYSFFYVTSSTEAKSLFGQEYLLGLVALPVGLIVWPARSKQSVRLMIGAGLLTVFISLVLIGLLFVPPISDSNTLVAQIKWRLEMAFLVPIVVSVLTLGIPYIIGAVISVLFAD